eukprot:126024_1
MDRLALFFLVSCHFITAHCGRFTKQPTCGDTKHFRFDEELPTYNGHLSYCQYYRGHTCCNKTHTDKIILNVYAYHEANMSSDCRSIGLNIGCSPCDPRIGTNQIQGICQSYCNQWYFDCRNDYFHYNKRGILTACSESDVVCSKLSSIATNGSHLCQLSGFDVSHISINCYDGIKAKFVKPPSDDEWETPIAKILNMIEKSTLNKNIKTLVVRFKAMPFSQKMLAMCGFAYTLFVVFRVITNACLAICCQKDEGHAQSMLSSEIFNNEEKEKQREQIRNKRLEYLTKQAMISDQMNMEMKLAKQLGLENEVTQDGTVNND